MDSVQLAVFRPAMDDASSHEPRITSIPETRRDLHIPVEVCERIIDFADAMGHGDYPGTLIERRHTLVACAFTCRAWRPLSQFHLFNAVCVDDIIRLRRLEGLLHDNAASAKSILDFTLLGNLFSPRILHNREQWTSQIAFTLRNLPRVQTLRLINCDWRWLHRTFLVLISGIASITHLRLSNVKFATTRELVLLVFSFPNLCSLSLQYIDCKKVRPYPKISRTSRALPLVNLDLLTGNYDDEVISCILCRLQETSSTESLQSLEVLEMDPSASHPQDVKTLLHFCPSLLSLDIQFVFVSTVASTCL